MTPQEELAALRRLAELEAKASGQPYQPVVTSQEPVPQQVPVAPGVPAWGQANPRLYGVAGALRETLGVPVEGIAAAIGGVAGGALGNPATVMLGGGLGYGIGKGITRYADELLGNAAPVSVTEGLSRAGGDMATGAILEGAGRIIAPPIAKAVGWVGDRLGGVTLDKLRAAKIARDAAGGQLPNILQASRNARSGINAGQAIEEAGVNAPPMQALADLAARKSSVRATNLAQAQAAERIANLERVAPNVPAAQATRTAAAANDYGMARMADAQRIVAIDQADQAAQQLYAQQLAAQQEAVRRQLLLPAAERAALARTGQTAAVTVRPPVPGQRVVPELQVLRGNPVIEASMRAAQARTPGLGDPMETLQGLHTMKVAIDAQIKNPLLPTSLQSMDRAALLDAKTQLLAAIDRVSPLYTAGRQNFATNTRPIEQGQILNELAGVLRGSGVKEEGTAYLNALGRGEDPLLRRAGINPAFGDVTERLLPNQLAPVNAAADEIVRDMRMAKSAAAGKAQLSDILAKDTFSLRQLIPNMLNAKASAALKGVDLAESRIARKTMTAIADAMQSGQSLEALLTTLPMSERNAILRSIIEGNPSIKAKLLQTVPMNALVQSENQNALTTE